MEKKKKSESFCAGRVQEETLSYEKVLSTLVF